MNPHRPRQQDKHKEPSKSKGKPAAAHTETAPAPEHPVLKLQRTIGNKGTRDLLGRPIRRRATRPSAPRRRSIIQRFESDEHMALGNEATRGEHGEIRSVQLAADYTITYGEMVALAGDFFGSIDEMRTLAANEGSGEGTREEIEYARVVKVHGDGGRANTFSEAARTAVEQRYYRLATNNRSHFLNPAAGDAARSVTDKADDVTEPYRAQWNAAMPAVTQGAPLNAGAGYRQNHVRALFEAYFAGLQNQSVDAAMAVEAFGAHFLTDAFAGGHVRTARAGINEHWNARVPMFNYNLKGYIAEKLAERLEKTLYAGILSEDAIFNGMLGQPGALQTVTEKLDSKGFITFGDVISGAIHDYDNEHGVQAISAGERVRLFGDGHLGEGDEQDRAMMAVNVSMQDVLMAWEAGKRRSDVAALLGGLMPEQGMFVAETMLPQVIANMQLPRPDRSIRWDYENVEDLLRDSQFREALQIFANEKASEFEAVAKELGDPQKERAFLDMVVKPLKDNPIGVIREVINWTPDTGGGAGGHNQDDNALSYYMEALDQNALTTLTVQQKVRIIRHLMDGATMGDEENAIWALLNANPADAATLIRVIGWDSFEDEIGSRFTRRYPENAYGQGR